MPPMPAATPRAVRVPQEELPADTRVEVPGLGNRRGSYLRRERRRLRPDRHWVLLDGFGGPVSL